MSFKAFLARGALCALLAGFSASGRADETKDITILRAASIGASGAALDVLKRALAAKGYTWKESVAELPSALLTASHAPTGALLDGFDIRDLAEAGKLGDVRAAAQNGDWAQLVPDPILRFLTVRGRWVAAPIDVTPVNGLWVNAALMDEIGGQEPKTIDEFMDLLDKAKQSGIFPLTIGNDPREQAALFDVVVLATAGADFYKRVFGDISEADIKSDDMRRAFDNLTRLRAYDDAGRDPDAATQVVVEGKALAHAGASPTKLAFAAAGKTAGKDYLCWRFPGTADSILYGLDLMAMPNVEASRRGPQAALAEAVMDEKVQIDVSLAKAAVPARGGIKNPGYDACGTLDYDDVKLALATGRFYGSMAHGYMQPPRITAAYVDVVAKFYRGEIKTSAEATAALLAALAKK